MVDRTASLEAEVERLRVARAEDADVTAGMLVRIAEGERLRLAAQARATALEAELVQARQLKVAAEARVEGTRAQMAAALELIEELERREEMAASLRARTIEQARRTLQGLGRTAPPPPETSFDQAWGLVDENAKK
jgi:hypothetical protein